MSMHFGALRSALVAASAIALPAVCGPAYAWDGHRHHHGSDAFLSFGFNSGPYYYDPYPYGPVYGYPPDYGYGGYDQGYGGYDQGYGGYDQGYDAEPTPYESGAYSGPYCREFQTTIVIDGRPQSAHGTACQQADGSWA